MYDESQKKMVASSYQNAFKYDISNLEIRLKSISEIPEDDDNKEILQASKDLFSYVIAKQKKVICQLQNER